MPLQGLMFLIFMFIIIPVLVLSTNHYLFFAVTALILVVGSIRSIYRRFFNIPEDDETSEDEDAEEIEDMFDMNMKKFGTGINVIKAMFLILFYVYCSFNLNSIFLKLPAALLILLQIHEIRLALNDNSKFKMSPALSRNIETIANIISLVLIILTSYNIIVRYGL